MNESRCFSGRPDPGSRAPVEEAAYDLLDGLGIAYQRVDHQAAPTMDSLQDVERELGCGVAKNLFLTNRQHTDFYLLVMPGTKPFRTKYLSAQLGCSRLSFAPEDRLFALLGVRPGCASVLALANDGARRVRLVLDRELLSSPFFACHPCLNSTTLKLSTADLTERLLPALDHDVCYVNLPWE